MSQYPEPPAPPSRPPSAVSLERAPHYNLSLRSQEFHPPAADAVDVAQLFTRLRQNRRRIFIIAAVVFGLALGLMLLSRMTFKATALMYLGELEAKERPPGSNRDEDEVELSGGGEGDLASDIEILKSTSLVTRAVLASGANVTVKPSDWTPPRYWQWYLSGRSTDLLDVAAKEIMAVNTSLLDRSKASDEFHVHFLTNVDYEISHDPSRFWPWAHGPATVVGRGRIGENVKAGGVSITLTPGTDRGPTAGADYNIDVKSVDDVVTSALKGALEVEPPTTKSKVMASASDRLKLATLSYEHKSPRCAAGFLDQLLSEFLQARQSWRTETATAAEAFLTNQLGATRQLLEDLQLKLAAYRTEHGVVVLDSEAKSIVDQIATYEEQRVAARLEAASLADFQGKLRQDRTQGQSPPAEAYMLGEAKDDTVLTSLASSLSEAQQKLTDLQSRFNGPSLEVRHQQEQVEAQLQGVQSYVSNRAARARENLRVLDGLIGQYEEKLKSVPAAQMGMAQLTREAEVYSAMYSFLLKRQQEMGLVKASTISKDRVLDHPDIPYKETPQRLILVLVSAPFGLMLGAGLVLMRGLFTGRLQHPGDVQRYLGQLPIVATIPLAPHGSDARNSPEFIEAFRTLRTNVLTACRRDRGNFVLVTSPCGGDGKTTCAYFLADTLARTGRSILLVEIVSHDSQEGRRAEAPVVAQGTNGGVALSCLEAWREKVQNINVTADHPLHALRVAAAPGTDLLSTTTMLTFVEDVRKLYEFIIFDVPAYPAVSDALVLSDIADCVLAVLRLEHTSRALAAENARQLSSMSARYGPILNGSRS